MTAAPRKVTRFTTELAALIREAELNEADIDFVPTLGGTEALAISEYSSIGGAKPLHWNLLAGLALVTLGIVFGVRASQRVAA